MGGTIDRLSACRVCGAPFGAVLVDLGPMPLANRLLHESDLERPEPVYPLRVQICSRCLLAQHDAVIAPELLFTDYPYFSSVSPDWVRHAARFAAAAKERLGLGAGSRVVEVASNDGYLLRRFRELGIEVLGIDPAANVARVAQAEGIPTEVRFFGEAVGLELAARGLDADLVVANNVLAHVPDLPDVLRGVRHLLRPAGRLSAEFPHLLHLMQGNEFDTIYHEHFFYFSLHAFERALAGAGLRAQDVETLPTHGGSLRVWAVRAEDPRPPGPGLAAVRAAETAAGLDRLSGYEGFPAGVRHVRRSLRAFLEGARRQGLEVAALGAAAKGATLLNACGIGREHLRYVVDETPAKIGRFMPGSHLPVLGPEALRRTRPDYVLILPWNHTDEIVRRFAWIRAWDAEFVVPIPELAVLPPRAAGPTLEAFAEPVAHAG